MRVTRGLSIVHFLSVMQCLIRPVTPSEAVRHSPQSLWSDLSHTHLSLHCPTLPLPSTSDWPGHIVLSQMKERLQLDMQDMKAQLQVVDSDSRLRLEKERAGFDRQLVDYQTDSHSAAASLSLRIQALEAQNAKVTFLFINPIFCLCSDLLSWIWKMAVSCSCPRSGLPSSWGLLQPPVLMRAKPPTTTVSRQSSSRPWRSGSLTVSGWVGW